MPIIVPSLEPEVMVPLTDLYPYILPNAPGAPDPLVDLAIIGAATEFCEETNTWSRDLADISLVDGEAQYTLELPEGAKLAAILHAWCNGRRVHGKPLQAIQALMPDWRTAVGPEPLYVTHKSGALTFFPKPMNSAGVKVQVRASFAPARGATTLPLELVDGHAEAIAAGALARLLLNPGRAWSNPVIGSAYGEQFRAAKVDERINVEHAGMAGSLSVVPRTFGR